SFGGLPSSPSTGGGTLIPAFAGISVGAITSDNTLNLRESRGLVLDWGRFSVSDGAPASEQGIVITGLPADGVLQFNTAAPGQAAFWVQVELNGGRYEVSRADI